MAAGLAVVLAGPAVVAGPVEAQDSGADRAGAGPGRVECREASGVFVLLCETYELVVSDYVDAVDVGDLAAAAAAGVREAGLGARAGAADGAASCALPAPQFEQACVEIDAVGDTTAAVRAATAAMLASLGNPYTFLMTPAQQAAYLTDVEGSARYWGIGVSLGLLSGAGPCTVVSSVCRLVVSEVFAGGPADRAGVMADDVLLELNGRVPAGEGCGLEGWRGFAPGERALVKVERAGSVLEFVMEAAVVIVPEVGHRVVEGGTGYVRLDGFSESADELVADALDDLLAHGIGALVLDLRGNPGGYLDTVVNMAGLFLGDGSAVAWQVSQHETLRRFAGGNRGVADPGVLPMAVVVDGRSASASEVLSLALRDHGRATLVGTTTFGKDTGQLVRSIEADDGTLLGVVRLTTLRWQSPLGSSAAGGIEPDVVLDLSSCLHATALARQVAAAAGLAGAEFADVAGGSASAIAVAALAGEGVFAGTECAPGLFCPDEPVPRWLATVWLVRFLDGADPEAAGAVRFVDVDPGVWWAAHAERLAELGVTYGCSRAPARLCADRTVTRAQMASFLRRALGLAAAAESAGFADTAASVAAADIDALYASGITLGCAAEPLRFCPDEPVSRAQMASFLHRARGS